MEPAARLLMAECMDKNMVDKDEYPQTAELERRCVAGLAEDRPNLVTGVNVQVCWEKFCRYGDVEPRLVPVGGGSTCLTARGAAAHCDERTIGVVAILGARRASPSAPTALRTPRGSAPGSRRRPGLRHRS